ncbi:MAG: flagellin lysine-N-methylase [Candidatus Izemoplasmatales bacterium]|nr:flagellin lysine-N-methylase [Candidatus Izemoplasmatales bacterium]
MAIKQALTKEKVRAIFVVPDYYKNFVCKGGDCRDSCCVGWKVTIPMNQYFLLHGLSCNKKVKEKIDRTFRPILQGTPERYAEIVHTMDGDCPLHKKDGYCLLHETCGEEVLPWVCRYYPRGPRIDYAHEASCANSCEKTLELLFENEDKLTFETKELLFMMTKPVKLPDEEHKILYQKIRKEIFVVLTNRNYLLHERIIHLGRYLKAIETNIDAKYEDLDLSIERHDTSVNENYQILWELLDNFEGRYKRLSEQLDEAKRHYLLKDVDATYKQARDKFDKTIEKHEIWFEKMLINDLFFKQFPFQTNFQVSDQYLALCGTYVILRYISMNLMFDKYTLADFIDIASKSFTVISHSEFDKLLAGLMKRYNLNDADNLAKILQF